MARFLRLPVSEKLCFLQAVTLLPLTATALRVTRLQRWQSVLLRPGAPPRGDAGEQLRRAQSVARMVHAAARRMPFQPTCLHRSVVLQFLLRRRGIPSELRLGSQFGEGGFQAHAWVEFAGQVLNDAGDVHLRYAPFERPAASDEARSR